MNKNGAPLRQIRRVAPYFIHVTQTFNGKEIYHVANISMHYRQE